MPVLKWSKITTRVFVKLVAIAVEPLHIFAKGNPRSSASLDKSSQNIKDHASTFAVTKPASIEKELLGTQESFDSIIIKTEANIRQISGQSFKIVDNISACAMRLAAWWPNIAMKVFAIQNSLAFPLYDIPHFAAVFFSIVQDRFFCCTANSDAFLYMVEQGESSQEKVADILIIGSVPKKWPTSMGATSRLVY